MLFIPYFTLLMCIVVYELQRKKVSYIDFLTIFNAFFSLFYVIPGILVSVWPEFYLRDISSKAAELTQNNVVVFIVVVCAYLLFLIPYLFVRKNIFYNGIPTVKTYTDPSYQKKIILFSVVMITIATILFTITIVSRGGLSQAIAIAGLLRSDKDSVMDKGFMSYLLYVYPYMFRASLILLTYAILVYPQMRLVKILLWGISFAMAILAGLVMGGRLNVLYPFVLVFITVVFAKQKIPWLIMTVFCLSSLFIIYFEKGLSNFFGQEQSLHLDIGNAIYSISSNRGNAFFSITREFCYMLYPIGSSISDMNPSEYQFFKTLLYSPLCILPSSIFNFNMPESVTYLSTFKVLGVTNIAITYPGIIAYGFFNLSWIGFILVMVLWGSILGYVDRIYNQYKKNCAFISLIYILLLIILGLSPFWGNPYAAARSLAIYVMICTFILLFRRLFYLK